MMYDKNYNEEAYLMHDLGDGLLTRHHLMRMLASIFLCLGPLFDAWMLWRIAYFDILNTGSTLFKFFSASYICVNVSTCLIGFWGMGFKNESALRSSLVLIVMQNTLMLIFATLVLICLSLKLNLFVLHHAPLFLQYLENNRKFGILCCAVMIIVRISCYFMVWSIGELEAGYGNQGYQDLKGKGYLAKAHMEDEFHIDISSENDEP